MSALDTPVRKITKNLIRKFGKAAVYRRVTATSAYTPSSGAVSVTTSDENVHVVEEAYKAREISGTIKAGDKKLLLAPTDEGLTAAPDLTGKFVVDSAVYQIISIETISSGALAGLYSIQVRR